MTPITLIVNYGQPSEQDDFELVPAFLADSARNIAAFIYTGRVHLSEVRAVEDGRLYIESERSITLGAVDHLGPVTDFLDNLRSMSAWDFVVSQLLSEMSEHFDYNFINPPDE